MAETRDEYLERIDAGNLAPAAMGIRRSLAILLVALGGLTVACGTSTDTPSDSGGGGGSGATQHNIGECKKAEKALQAETGQPSDDQIDAMCR